MKRIATLVLGAAMALGSVSAANAIDVKVKGNWDFGFGWDRNTSFYDNSKVEKGGTGSYDHFIARQRIRTQINFIASENLQGVLMFEIGTIDWGRGDSVGRSSGGALDADGVNIETKRAYLDWMIPETSVSVRMGIQGIALPSATGFGNPVLNSDVAGIVVSAPITDMLSIAGVWVRPFDAQKNDGNRSMDDETDIFALLLPVAGEGWSVTPWGAYAQVGTASGFYEYILNYNGGDFASSGRNNTEAWWAGVAVEVSMFDPLTFAFDVAYGDLHRAEFGAGAIDSDLKSAGTRGWFVDAALNYKLDWGTPGLLGWWSSGDREAGVNAGRFGRMPALGFDSGFAPTSFGSPGSYSVGIDSLISNTMLGTWGAGAQIADMSFVEDLSHTLRVVYMRGTNEHTVVEKLGGGFVALSGESMYLTDKDWAVEVNFDHVYKIYENLSAIVELGYIHMDLDEDVWGKDKADTDNAWKAHLLFRYHF